MLRKWTLTPFFLCVVALAACTQEPPEITRPNNRIQYFIGKKFSHMTSQEKYQDFIEHELGSFFSENDFIEYMTRNEAECNRSSLNNIVYCQYIDFKSMPYGRGAGGIDRYYMPFCFAVIPSPDRTIVSFRAMIGRLIPSFPTLDRREFARQQGVPDCRTLWLKEHGVEK